MPDDKEQLVVEEESQEPEAPTSEQAPLDEAKEGQVEASPPEQETVAGPRLTELEGALAREKQLRQTAEGRLKETDKSYKRLEHIMRRSIPEEEWDDVNKGADQEAEFAALQEKARSEVEVGLDSLKTTATKMEKSYSDDPAFLEVREMYANGLYLSANAHMQKLYDANLVAKAQDARVARDTKREAMDIAAPAPAASTPADLTGLSALELIRRGLEEEQKDSSKRSKIHQS